MIWYRSAIQGLAMIELRRSLTRSGHLGMLARVHNFRDVLFILLRLVLLRGCAFYSALLNHMACAGSSGRLLGQPVLSDGD